MSDRQCDPNILPDNCTLIPCGIATETEVIDTNGTVVCPPPVEPGVSIKVPRWLQRVVISGCVKSTITIAEGFSEIKGIDKKVIITQAKLICDELMVEGYILKDIKYVRPSVAAGTDTRRCLAYPNAFLDISEKVPFTLCMTVTGLPLDVFPTPNTNQTSEFNFLCDTQSHQCCDRGVMSPSLCETLRIQTNYLNERPFAELVGYRIAELDLNKKPCNEGCPCPPVTPCLYSSLTEKVKLDIVFDLYVLGIACSACTTFPVPPQPPITGVCIPNCAPPCQCASSPENPCQNPTSSPCNAGVVR